MGWGASPRLSSTLINKVTIMKHIVLALMTTLVSSQVLADEVVIIGPSSHNMSTFKGMEIENNTYGLGYSLDISDNLAVQSGVYHNSFGGTSVYLMPTYDVFNVSILTFGVGAGLVYGYDKEVSMELISGSKVSPFGILFAEAAISDTVSVGVTFVPAVNKNNPSATTLVLKFSL